MYSCAKFLYYLTRTILSSCFLSKAISPALPRLKVHSLYTIITQNILNDCPLRKDVPIKANP